MTGRILTSHVGSLPRPTDLLDLYKQRAEGRSPEPGAVETRVRQAVADIVVQQREHGVDVVTDGEMSKPGFFAYVRERLGGLETRAGAAFPFTFEAEEKAFPEYYERYFAEAMIGGTVAPLEPLVCTGPLVYRGEDALQRDLDNLGAVVDDRSAAFLPSIAPSGVGVNEYYGSEEEVRFHTCYSINEGPRVFDVPFAHTVDLVLKVNARVYSFEAANPRHEHEYHLWEDVALPDGKVLMRG